MINGLVPFSWHISYICMLLCLEYIYLIKYMCTAKFMTQTELDSVPHLWCWEKLAFADFVRDCMFNNFFSVWTKHVLNCWSSFERRRKKEECEIVYYCRNETKQFLHLPANGLVITIYHRNRKRAIFPFFSLSPSPAHTCTYSVDVNCESSRKRLSLLSAASANSWHTDVQTMSEKAQKLRLFAFSWRQLMPDSNAQIRTRTHKSVKKLVEEV